MRLASMTRKVSIPFGATLTRPSLGAVDKEYVLSLDEAPVFALNLVKHFLAM
jgi:hypothetical protein